MQGIDGYVRQDGMSGLEAFVPQEPPQTRWHVAPGPAARGMETIVVSRDDKILHRRMSLCPTFRSLEQGAWDRRGQ